MLSIATPIYDPQRRADVMTNVMDIEFDPTEPNNPKEAAHMFHTALVKEADAAGYSTKYIYLWSPEETNERGYGNCWSVFFEDGPYDWGIDLSIKMHGKTFYCETYYGFDLLFYPK